MRTDQDLSISIRGTDSYPHPSSTVPTKPFCTCSSVPSPPHPGCQSDISSLASLDSSAGNAHQIGVADESTAARWRWRPMAGIHLDQRVPRGSSAPNSTVQSGCDHTHHIWTWEHWSVGDLSERVVLAWGCRCRHHATYAVGVAQLPSPLFFFLFLLSCSSHRVISGRSGIIPKEANRTPAIQNPPM